MNFILIISYPYDTIKKFFNNVDEINSYSPPLFVGWSGNKLLKSRLYELETYSEELKENEETKEIKKIIKYSIKDEV